jgi:hypothetical protein
MDESSRGIEQPVFALQPVTLRAARNGCGLEHPPTLRGQP